MNRRLFFLNLLFFLFTAAIVVRLFLLQVVDHTLYQTLADNQHQLFKTLVPSRGEIFVHESKNSKLLSVVTNIEKDLVYVVPQEITDQEKVAAALSPLLGLTRFEITQKLSDPDRKWVAIKKELTESESLKIKAAKLPGVYLQSEAYRFYPEGTFASQLLGFLGFVQDRRLGRYGIEEFYEDQLAGKTGTLSLEKDPRGRWISGALRKLYPAEDGADIVLTVDQAIQFQAESVLKDTVEAHEADYGSIVVMDPKTGAILALANFPSFDPNAFGKVADQKVFRNSVVSDAFEPGSVFKPMTMAAAIDAGAVTPDMTYEDTGAVAIDKFVIKNSDGKSHGVQTMTEVLEKSLNTGAIFVQDKLGPEKFYEAVKNFGFGSRTGITLPAEAPGKIDSLVGGGDIHYATASFGQGITATVLQLALAYGAIANGGKFVKPYIVETLNYQNGKTEETHPEEVRQVISPRTANTIAAMLVSVVDNGHGKKAGVPGYYVAGKTGTAQVAKAEGGGYDPNITNGTFAGFAPVDDPKFVMVVRINNPKNVKFAESTAAPAFGQMARFLLNYYQVPPTRQ